MKIVCFSDSHCRHEEIELPKADLMIFTGDCMGRGTNSKELSRFVKWFDKQPAKHKVMIAGNHDRFFEYYPDIARQIVAQTDVIYLQDSGVEIEGLKLWGTPSQPEFYNWSHNDTPEQMRYRYSLIPIDTDILLTHCPPYGILDKVEDVWSAGIRVGSEQLTERLVDLNLMVHTFGHIHGDFGMYRAYNTYYINASSLNEEYEVRSIKPYHTVWVDKLVGVIGTEEGIK